MITLPSALPVAVIGAGPVGLAAAAELVARGLPVVILEAGEAAGANIRRWAHVRMFSPWRFNIAPAARALLEVGGWQAPDPASIPTGAELVADYLEPLARHPALRAALRLRTRVVAVARDGLDKLRDSGRAARPFLLRLVVDGEERDLLARAVIDCSGTFAQSNHGGAHGLPARGEARNRDRIAYAMPDVLDAARSRYAGRRVAVLGSGHSAIGVILDLIALRAAVPGTGILWLSRRAELEAVYGGAERDALPARGALGTRLRAAVAEGVVETVHPFALEAIEAEGGALRLLGAGQDRAVVADELVIATGFRPDLAMLGEVRLDLDPALEAPRALGPLIDPNLHSCGTVPPHGARELAQPEPDFYIAGMKSYGRAPTFLLATGHEQVRSIAAALAGDMAAAARVELVLPETGVCVTDIIAGGCCGGPPRRDEAACCRADEAAKAAGAAGCGCGAPA